MSSTSVQFDPQALQDAIDGSRFRSTAKFIEALREQGRARGISQTYIFDYLKGRRVPSRAALKEMARILEVLESYLETGTGPRNEMERLAYRSDRKAKPAANGLEVQVQDGFREGWPGFDRLGYGQRALWWAWARVSSSALALQPQGPAHAAKHWQKEAARIAKAARAPLDALGVQADQLSQEQADLYCAAVCGAIAAMAVNSYGSQVPRIEDAVPPGLDVEISQRAVVRSAAPDEPREEMDGEGTTASPEEEAHNG